jgi:hypothetical protein
MTPRAGATPARGSIARSGGLNRSSGGGGGKSSGGGGDGEAGGDDNQPISNPVRPVRQYVVTSFIYSKTRSINN